MTTDNALIPIPQDYLAQLDVARTALERARTLDDVQQIHDLAVAAQHYSKARRLGLQAQNYATEIVLRANRRLGEMLRSQPKHPPGPDPKDPSALPTDLPPTLKELRITRDQSAEAQQIAAIPDPVFEHYLSQTRDANRELTKERLLRIAREARAEARRAAPVPALESADLQILHGDFREVLDCLEPGSVDVIITDPPYSHEALPLLISLSAVAARLLKPGGTLAVLYGKLRLPHALPLLGEHLTYRGCGCWLAQGRRTRLYTPRIATGWKPVLLFTERSAPPPAWLQDDVFVACEDDKTHHRWGQNLGGIAQMVERLSRPGDLVVDPFLGGGTVALACQRLGRRFVGCDIDAAAVHTTLERLDRERS